MELLSYMLSMLAVAFWFFRTLVALAPNIGLSMPVAPTNLEWEIIVLFLSLIGLVGIFRRNVFLTTITLAAYIGFFGTEGLKIIEANETLQGENLLNIVIFAVGTIIALLNVLDVAFNNNRTGKKRDKKTDWYYDTEKYERELDERADKNRYRIN